MRSSSGLLTGGSHPFSGHATSSTVQMALVARQGRVITTPSSSSGVRRSLSTRSSCCSASANDEQRERDSVEMYVASGDDRDAESSINRLRVAPPRAQSSAGMREQPGSGEGLQRLLPTDHTKALRAELRVTGAELRSKSAELSEAKQIVHAKEKEMALLREALINRDEQLHKSKGDVLKANLRIQDKDEELQGVYKRLSEASKERSDVRGALIGTQTELAETQAELDAWTHELDSFQQALLSMHEDPPLLNGASSSQTEAMSAQQQSISVSKGVPKMDAKTQDMLQKLSELSTSLVQDAKEDDEIFRSKKAVE